VGLCAPSRCGCAIRSNTLIINGAGSPTNPYDIDTAPEATGQYRYVFASSIARAAGLPSPVDGDEANITSANELTRFVDGTWLTVRKSLTAFTPVITGVTVGNGTLTGRYSRAGDMVFYNGRFVFGSTSAVPGTISLISVPVPIFGDNRTTGRAGVYDFSTARIFPVLMDARASGPGLSPYNNNGTLTFPVTGTTPVTWAVGDELWWNIRYSAA
jgi:hypothetical protein